MVARRMRSAEGVPNAMCPSKTPFSNRGWSWCGFWVLKFRVYRGTSLIRNSAPVGPYGRTIPRALWWP